MLLEASVLLDLDGKEQVSDIKGSSNCLGVYASEVSNRVIKLVGELVIGRATIYCMEIKLSLILCCTVILLSLMLQIPF